MKLNNILNMHSIGSPISLVLEDRMYLNYGNRHHATRTDSGL